MRRFDEVSMIYYTQNIGAGFEIKVDLYKIVQIIFDDQYISL